MLAVFLGVAFTVQIYWTRIKLVAALPTPELQGMLRPVAVLIEF